MFSIIIFLYKEHKSAHRMMNFLQSKNICVSSICVWSRSSPAPKNLPAGSSLHPRLTQTPDFQPHRGLLKKQKQKQLIGSRVVPWLRICLPPLPEGLRGFSACWRTQAMESEPFVRLKSWQVQKLMPSSISLVSKNISTLTLSQGEWIVCWPHTEVLL